MAINQSGWAVGRKRASPSSFSYIRPGKARTETRSRKGNMQFHPCGLLLARRWDEQGDATCLHPPLANPHRPVDPKGQVYRDRVGCCRGQGSLPSTNKKAH